MIDDMHFPSVFGKGRLYIVPEAVGRAIRLGSFCG